MQKLKLPLILILLGAAFATLGFAGMAQDAQPPSADELIRGALLYDNWIAALETDAPAGDMPIWSRQSTNTRSGAATWRCSECHGWDYKGKDGAYASGSHYTGFPSLQNAIANMSVEEIVSHLQGSRDPAHDFSAYLDETDLQQLAGFIKFGMVNDDEYIDDLALTVKDADVENGQKLFEGTCAACHGIDGKTIVFRTEGVNEYLGSVAARDPWRFLHRTRYGVAGTPMPVAASLGWTVEDGRDVLAYAQTLPTGQETSAPGPASEQATDSPLMGGPATGLWGGILTGLAAFFGIFGGALVFGAILIAIGAAVVWVLRGRK